MKNFSCLALGLAFFLLQATFASAETPGLKYTLTVEWNSISGSWESEAYFLLSPIEEIIPGKKTAYRSASAVKKALGALPRGTDVTWSPSCIVLGPVPLKQSDLEEWKATCAKAGVKLTLLMAG